MSIVLAHPLPAIVAILAILFVAALRWIVIPLIDKPERPLSPEDRRTLALMERMRAEDTGGLRELHHEPFPAAAGRWASTLHSAPIWTPVQIRGALTWPAGITNLGPGAGDRIPPVTTATCTGAIATPKVDSPAPATGTRLIPAGDRDAAAAEATSPWQPREPFAKWESDTFVGGLPPVDSFAAIAAGWDL